MIKCADEDVNVLGAVIREKVARIRSRGGAISFLAAAISFFREPISCIGEDVSVLRGTIRETVARIRSLRSLISALVSRVQRPSCTVCVCEFK